MSTLKNKTLFVSGASRGIGLAIAKEPQKMELISFGCKDC